MPSTWTALSINDLKPKLAAALRVEFTCAIKVEHYQIFKAWRSFHPYLARGRLLTSHISVAGGPEREKATTDGSGVLAPSTLLAVDANDCGLATVNRYEVKEQLGEIVIRANAIWESRDTTECHKNILRW